MRVFGILVCLFATWCGHCAEPSVVSQLDVEELFKGETATLTVQVTNATDDTKLDLSALETDFVVVLSGGPSTSSFTQINNGRMSQKNSTTWQYRLTPKKSGLLNLPGPVAVDGGKRYSAQNLRLNVKEIAPQDVVLIEVSAPPKVYRVSFEVTVRIRVKPLPDGSSRDPVSVLSECPVLYIDWVEHLPDGLNADAFQTWLQKYITQVDRGFSINEYKLNNNDPFAMFERQRLAVFSLYTGREIRKGLDGKDLNYFVYELKRTFTPQRTGVFKLGSVTLKGTFADKMQKGQLKGSRYVIPAESCAVEVCDVPTPRPANFIGGIGRADQYAIAISASPLTLRVGDPLTLKLSVERKAGGGPLDTIAAPDLSLLPEITGDFEIIDKSPTGEVQGETKNFSYSLRPKRAGVTIPALTFSIFDPATEKFNTLTTPAIALTVTAASQLHADEIVSSAHAPVARSLKNVEGGIFQNISDLNALGNQQVNPYQHWGVVLGLLLVYLAVAALVVRSRRLAGDESWQRRQRAWPESNAALTKAREVLQLQAGERSLFASHLRLAFSGLIGNLLNRPSAGLTPVEAGQVLSVAGLENALQTRTVQLLEQIDALQYASISSTELESLLTNATQLLPELRRALGARKA